MGNLVRACYSRWQFRWDEERVLTRCVDLNDCTLHPSPTAASTGNSPPTGAKASQPKSIAGICQCPSERVDMEIAIRLDAGVSCSRSNRVSTRLAASFRLQRTLQSKEPPPPPEAVLAPSGRVLHAEQPAQDRPIRDALSDACQSIERARTRKGRADGEISLSLWRSLVCERWTLVDSYERDGKRYVVARRSDVRMPLPNVLSPRERQALGFAALGDSNKLVAYELGISASTVGVLLFRAAQKLGCHSRAELLQRFRELLASAPPQPTEALYPLAKQGGPAHPLSIYATRAL
jgi:DNA-binding CsgD family transcriptional regulator